MNTVYVYLMASSWFFLLGWVALLLVAYALAFRGDSAYGLVWTGARSGVTIEPRRQRARNFAFNSSKVNGGGQERPPHTHIPG
jgi:hypothetical protein